MMSQPWRNEDTLRELYLDDKMSQQEIADELGCHVWTVGEWMSKYGIETRKDGRLDHVSFRTTIKGYENWNHRYDNDVDRVAVHRLLALVENGIDEVGENHVHHKNGVKWDNRPDNIEVMGPGEHISKHFDEKSNFNQPKKPNEKWKDPDTLKRLHHDEGMNLGEIGDKFEVTKVTISYWMNKYEIKTRDHGELVSESMNDNESYKDQNKLKELYIENDMSCRSMADDFNVSTNTVRYWLKKHDLLQKSEGVVAKQEVDELYSTDMTMKEVADELGCSIGTVSRRVNNE